MNPANLKRMNAEKRARVIAMGQMGPLGGLSGGSLPEGMGPVAPRTTAMIDPKSRASMDRAMQAKQNASFRMGGRGTGAASLQKRPTIKLGGGGLGGVNTGMMHGPNLPPAGKKGILSGLSSMKLRTKVGIGLGLGVAASVAMNRRGEGVSPGRQSNTRY